MTRRDAVGRASFRSSSWGGVGSREGGLCVRTIGFSWRLDGASTTPVCLVTPCADLL